jgi:hypothetical protein
MATAAYTNGYRPFDFKDFSGGLNLRDKADAVGDREAIDLLNVTFGERGAIRQRDGYGDLTTADFLYRVDSLSPYYKVDGTRQLVAGTGLRLEVVNNAGAPVGALAGRTGGAHVFARFGDPTNEYLYCANGVDTIARWQGFSWADGTVLATVNGVAGQAMPKAGAICVTAAVPGSTSGTNASNRLVATAFGTQTNAGPGGAVSTPSRVYLSNPGQPEVWETSGLAIAPPPSSGPAVYGRNYVDLTPGDGEQIMAAVTWRELVFIFKETKFFVLWGEGTGADGTPTFQVREVVNSVGLASKMAVAVGRDGVYFMNRRGVYRTSGSDPVLLSDIVSPMWTQDPEIYFQSSPINLAKLDLPRAHWHMERLYLAVPTGAAPANDRMLVYDAVHGWWSLLDVPASALCSFRADVRSGLTFGYSTGPNRIGRQLYGSTRDRNTQTIVSRWRSGWSDYGSSQQVTLRETKVWGSGAVIVSFATDFNEVMVANLDTNLGLGATWPNDGDGTWDNWTALQGGKWPGTGQISDQLVRRAVRGTVFSTQFSNSPQSETWSVHRIARHLREVRQPSVR